MYLGFAMGYCQSDIGRLGESEATQVFWPDGNGKFPFDVGCEADEQLRSAVTCTDSGLTARELRELRRQGPPGRPRNYLGVTYSTVRRY